MTSTPISRKHFTKQRKALTPSERHRHAKRASLHLVRLRPLLPKHARIALYQDSFGELPTFGIVAFCLQHGFTPYLPIVQGKRLKFAPIVSKNKSQFAFAHTPKTRHPLGMFEPVSPALLDIDELHACFCPLVALDRTGVRLGMGGGFYDRTLAQFTGLKIGWCYEFQIVDTLPKNAWDIKMDMAISETGLYRF